jgi:excisionase family DNA binding protein
MAAATTTLENLIQAVFPSQRQWLTYAQAARETSMSRSTLYRRIKDGRIDAKRVSKRLTLISRESLDKFLSQ